MHPIPLCLVEVAQPLGLPAMAAADVPINVWLTLPQFYILPLISFQTAPCFNLL